MPSKTFPGYHVSNHLRTLRPAVSFHFIPKFRRVADASAVENAYRNPRSLSRHGRTIAQLFADKLNSHEQPRFDLESSIIRRVSRINDGIARLDLLPSSIRLIDLQDRIPTIALAGNFTVNPLDILKGALQPVMDRYDYVIIDCPPSLGTVTKNGLRISTGYIIPTIPDIVSTWGIYQIVDNVHRFSQDIDRPIPALGIVATKVQPNNLHRRVIEDLKARRLGHFAVAGALAQPPLFLSTISQRVDVARGADVEADIRTFRGKYGNAYAELRHLTQEIKQTCEKKSPDQPPEGLRKAHRRGSRPQPRIQC
jgi:chromosome partitioning protein